MSTTTPRTRRSRLRWCVPVLAMAAIAAGCTRPDPGPGPSPTTGPGPVTTQPGGGGGSLPPVTSVTGNGPFRTTIDQNRDYWVFRPATLGEGGVKHPIFVWGTGATAVPRQYTDHFNQMASHGIVIVAPTPAMLTAANMNAATDWIKRVAGTTYGGNLDLGNIAMGGHSQGSTSTFDAEASRNDLKTTIHISGGSFDGRGSSKVKTPTAYMCGADDTLAGSNCRRDFTSMRTPGPATFFTMMRGADHMEAARAAIPAMIAWLRWHLAGETQWRAAFSPGGQFHTGIFQSQVKNWG